MSLPPPSVVTEFSNKLQGFNIENALKKEEMERIESLKPGCNHEGILTFLALHVYQRLYYLC